VHQPQCQHPGYESTTDIPLEGYASRETPADLDNGCQIDVALRGDSSQDSGGAGKGLRRRVTSRWDRSPARRLSMGSEDNVGDGCQRGVDNPQAPHPLEEETPDVVALSESDADDIPALAAAKRADKSAVVLSALLVQTIAVGTLPAYTQSQHATREGTTGVPLVGNAAAESTGCSEDAGVLYA
jgi:hypothetical protein